MTLVRRTNSSLRIGLIRISSLGDIILITPIIRCLYLQLEKPELVLITHPDMLPLFEHNPYLHSLIGYDRNDSGKSAAEFLGTMPDLIIDLQKNLRSRALTLGAGVPILSLNKENIKKWMLVNAPGFKNKCSHVVTRMFNALRALNIRDDGAGVELHLPLGKEPEENKEGVIVGAYVAIGIGSAHETKALSFEFLDRFLAIQTLPCVLLGGPNDQKKGEELETKYPNIVKSMCGQTTLLQTAFMVQNAVHVVSGDSFIMHLAACFSKPMDIVWANTVPEFGMEPYFGTQRPFKAKYHQVNGLNCRPCSKTGFGSCPKGHHKCMTQIAAWIVQESNGQKYPEPITF